MAVGDGSDTVIVGGNGGVTVKNFQAGTGGDVVQIDISDVGAVIGGDGTNETAATTVLIVEATGTDTVAAAENIVVLSGTNFATTALAEAAIENGGSYELTLATAPGSQNDDLLVVWSDGSNSYLGSYNFSASTPATNPLVGDLTVLAQIDGVVASTAGTLVSTNFDFI